MLRQEATANHRIKVHPADEHLISHPGILIALRGQMRHQDLTRKVSFRSLPFSGLFSPIPGGPQGYKSQPSIKSTDAVLLIIVC